MLLSCWDRVAKRLPLWIVFLFWPAVAAHTAFAQLYPFKVFSTKDGLVHANIERIRQDSQGDFWICTTSGLSFFDGMQFTNLLNKGKDRSYVKDVLELDSVYWAATEGRGIAVISRNKEIAGWMRRGDGLLPSDSVFSFHRDSRGNIWIGTAQGLLMWHHDGTRTLFDSRNGLPYNRVTRIMELSDGVFLLVAGRELMAFRVTDQGLIDRRILAHDVLGVFATGKDEILAGTSEGPGGQAGRVLRCRISGQIDTILSVATLGKPLKVLSLLKECGGAIWVGDAGGLYVMDGEHVKALGKANGLPHRSINALFEDRTGAIWIGTGGGLVKLPRRHFISYALDESIKGHYRFALLDSKQSLWFGGFGNLIVKEQDKEFRRISPVGPRKSWNVHALAEDSSGSVWIGAVGGLFRFSKGKMDKPVIKGLPPLNIASALCVDPSGDLLVGTYTRIYRIRASRVVRVYGPKEGIPHDSINDITVDRSGTIWFGTQEHGLGMIAPGRTALFSTEDGLPSNCVMKLAFDADSTLWCSTTGGYALYVNGAIGIPRLKGIEEEFLITYAVVQDKEKNYWMFTTTGIYELRDSLVAHFDGREGMPSDEVPCGVFDQTGNLWVGTTDGMAFVRAVDLRHEIPVPRVRLERIHEQTGEIIRDPGRTFSHDQNFFSFRISAADFVDRDETEFEWRMGGTDENWHSDFRGRIVRYPLLPPGEYELQVRARNHNGAWSDVVSYAFAITPPFWKTGWFFFLAAALATVLFWLIYSYRIRQIMEVERVRMRIAGDLHDEIGSNLGSIALESQMLTNRDHINRDARQTLETITGTARRTSDAMRDIVWLIDPENDTFAQLISRMREVAGKMLKGRSYSFDVGRQVDSDAVELEFKRNVFLMYKELLHNIVKHSRAKKVRIRLENDGAYFRMEISDDGVGFNPESAAAGHGWKSLRLRAQYLKARLNVDSHAEKGTTVLLEARIPQSRYSISRRKPPS